MPLTTILPSGLNSANDFSSLVPAAFGQANSAASFANGAFTTANNALPKSGGTITGNVIFSGTNANLHFSGAAARITGDFTNATIASRTMFQTSTTDGVTNIYAIPNGTGATTTFSAVNNSNPTNAGIVQVGVNAAGTFLLSNRTGSGTYLPFFIQTSGTEKLNIAADATGTYTFGGTAPRIRGDFTNATADSRLGFQTTTTNSPSDVMVIPNGTSNVAAFRAKNSSDPNNSSDIVMFVNNIEARIYSQAVGTGAALPLTFVVNGSERFRIDTSGNANIPGTLIIQSTTASTSNTTGAFEVIGGVGIQGNVYTGAIRVTGSTANGITFADGTTQYTANVLDSWVRGTTNASFLTANSAASFANGAFGQANLAFAQANAAFAQANTGGGGGTTDAYARDTANAGFITANSGSSFANGAFITANSGASFANAAFDRANAAYNTANTGGGGGADAYARDTANAAFITANAAFLQANSGGGGGTTDAYARDTANASYTSQNTTAGFANAAYTHANAAFAAANTGGGGGGTTDSWARDTANASFLQANSSASFANAAYTHANAAFLKANTEILILAVVDETTNVTTGSARASFRAPSAMTLTSIPRASLNVASTSGLVTCDIKLNGTTILGANKLSIDATEKTSTTAATATTLATTAISDDAEITVDITAPGVGAKGLKITFYYTD